MFPMTESILIGGQAGQGVAKASTVLGKMLVKHGFYVFNYRDYPSLIRGGHNFNIVTFDRDRVFSHSYSNITYALLLDQRSFNTHKEKFTDNTTIITLDSVDTGNFEAIKIPSKDMAKKGIPPMSFNVVLLSALTKLMGLNKDIVEEIILSSFKGSFNEKAYREGIQLVESKEKTEVKVFEDAYFLTGNEAIAMGAIASGIDMYIAYPMTPSTPVLHYISSVKDKYGITVLQPENEISVVNMALGASYAGAVTMVGTSGGGFALMNEALSLQGMSEVPLVVYLAQRTGPSTGVPTYTAQTELLYSIFAGHGEFPRFVVAPGDAAEAFSFTIDAFHYAYRYRVLSIILGDKHVGESHFTHHESEFVVKSKPGRYISFPRGEYKSYEITDDGITPRAVPGSIDYPVRATSYEHDEWGITTEEAEMVEKMMEKRLKKWDTLSEAVLSRSDTVSVYGEGDNVIVSWGSTKGAILDALKHLKGWKFVKINILWPFPEDRVRELLEGAERIVLVENTSTGQLSRLISMETGIFVDEMLLKYDARPFTPEDIVRGLKG